MFKLHCFFFFQEKGPFGFTPPSFPPAVEKDQNTPFNPVAFSYNIPLDNANSNKPVIKV